MPYCLMLRSGQNDAAQRPVVSVTWALVALALFLLWQFLTVHYNRGGNWTALFLTGQDYAMPPEIVPGTYRFPGAGYDGEMYRDVAHDPFLQRGYARYLDGPAERYHRILVPGLAYVLAAERQPWIDSAYIAVVAMFVFLGAYWLGHWVALAGLHAAWALAFLLVPATLISMDRMTVDVALAAFTVAFALYLKNESRRKLFLVLLLACLVRETGILLVAGVCLVELLNRRWARAVFWASTALPTIAWYMFIRMRLPEKTRFAREWGPGLFQFLFHPPRYPLPHALELIARFADVCALAAIVLAMLLALLLLRAQTSSPIAVSASLFVVLIFLMTTKVYWIDVNGYARVLSPLLILVALPSLARENGSVFPWWLGLVPAMVLDLRLALQFPAAIVGILRGLLHR